MVAALWYFKFEIDDELNVNFVLGDNVFHYGIGANRRNENLLTLLLDRTIESRLVNGHELRIYGDRVPFTGLGGLWAFQDDGADESPNRYTLTANGGVGFTTGKYGRASLFDGVDDYWDAGDQANLSVSNNKFVIAFWARFDDLAHLHGVIGKRGTPWEYSIHVNTAGTLVFIAWNSAGSNVYTTSKVIPDTSWHRWIWTSDGTNAYLYMDGVLQTTVAKSANDMSDTSAVFQIGRAGSSAGVRFMKGALQNVRFYKDVSWTQQDVTDDYLTTAVRTKKFTMAIQNFEPSGINDRTITLTALDIFKDRINTRTVNKKFPDQDTATTVDDVIDNFIGSGFTSTEVVSIGVSQPYNAVEEYAYHLLERIENSTFGDIFMRATKSVVYQRKQIESSGLTITDSMMENLEALKKRKAITESFGKIKVVGGLSTKAFDLNKRIIATSEVPNAPANIKDRTFSHVDDRFTTWEGAKELSIALRNKFGHEYFIIPQPLRVKDLTDIPRAGTLIRVNSTELVLTSVNDNYIIDNISISGAPGEVNTEYFDIKIGDREQTETEKLAILQSQFESEKRKALDADTFTNQKSLTIPIKTALVVTAVITKRNKTTQPYLWGNGSDRASDFKWGFWTWEDGVG